MSTQNRPQSEEMILVKDCYTATLPLQIPR